MMLKRYDKDVLAKIFHPVGFIQKPLGLVTADSSNTELISVSSLLSTMATGSFGLSESVFNLGFRLKHIWDFEIINPNNN